MKNIRFNYKYRDAANYKEYGALIFSNPNKLSMESIMSQFKEVLIEEAFFIPQACKIPLIHSFPFDPELDPEWYELDYLGETNALNTTCPYCGARTEIIMDLSCTKYQTQLHECLKCKYLFIEEND